MTAQGQPTDQIRQTELRVRNVSSPIASSLESLTHPLQMSPVERPRTASDYYVLKRPLSGHQPLRRSVSALSTLGMYMRPHYVNGEGNSFKENQVREADSVVSASVHSADHCDQLSTEAKDRDRLIDGFVALRQVMEQASSLTVLSRLLENWEHVDDVVVQTRVELEKSFWAITVATNAALPTYESKLFPETIQGVISTSLEECPEAHVLAIDIGFGKLEDNTAR